MSEKHGVSIVMWSIVQQGCQWYYGFLEPIFKAADDCEIEVPCSSMPGDTVF